MRVGVRLGVLVADGVAVSIGVCVWVADGTAVSVGVCVLVGDGTAVSVGVCVLVSDGGIGEGVVVGIAHPPLTLSGSGVMEGNTGVAVAGTSVAVAV